MFYPPPLSTGEPGSFARYTFERRMPVMIDDVIAGNDFPTDIVDALRAFKAEVAEGVIRPLGEKAPDVERWRAEGAGLYGRAWLDAPWYAAEAFFFRRLLEATRYFQAGPWQGQDPFGSQKRREMTSDAMREVLAGNMAAPGDSDEARFGAMLRACLAGNRADLSHAIAADAWRAGPSVGVEIVVDQTREAWRLIAAAGGRIDVIVDNAGVELMRDLLLAAFLMERDPALRLTLHVKSHPMFVSDAVAADVDAAIARLDGENGAGSGQALLTLRAAFDAGRLGLAAHPMWTSCLFFRDMPDDLKADLAQAKAVFIKGDANYRRLIGDARWEVTTPLAVASAGFPASGIAVRTLKSDPLVGLPHGLVERLDAEDPQWRINGRRGVIQTTDDTESADSTEKPDHVGACRSV
ncbi:MAG: damage-control phosphatase ARMT1 family protein [Thermoflexales bacterium]